MIEYKVEIKTTDKFRAGTDNDVFVEIRGTAGKIDYRKVNNKWKNDFEKGKVSTFQFEHENIGKSNP